MTSFRLLEITDANAIHHVGKDTTVDIRHLDRLRVLDDNILKKFGVLRILLDALDLDQFLQNSFIGTKRCRKYTSDFSSSRSSISS